MTIYQILLFLLLQAFYDVVNILIYVVRISFIIKSIKINYTSISYVFTFTKIINNIDTFAFVGLKS